MFKESRNEYSHAAVRGVMCFSTHTLSHTFSHLRIHSHTLTATHTLYALQQTHSTPTDRTISLSLIPCMFQYTVGLPYDVGSANCTSRPAGLSAVTAMAGGQLCRQQAEEAIFTVEAEGEHVDGRASHRRSVVTPTRLTTEVCDAD